MQLWIGLLVLIWVVPVGAATPPTTGQPLMLVQAFALVLENNPRLKAASFDTKAAVAKVHQQLQSTPWKMGVDLDNMGGSGSYRDLKALETTLSLGKVLELGGKASKRGDIARVEMKLLENEQYAQRIDLLAETTLRFIAVAKAQRQQQMFKERVGHRKQTLAAVEKRFQLGQAGVAEKSRAKLRLVEAKLALEEIDNKLVASKRLLSALWGVTNPSFHRVSGDLYRLEFLPSSKSLDRLMTESPALVRFALQQQIADAQLRLAQASRSSDIEVRGGVRHFNESDDMGLLLSLNIPLGSESRSLPVREQAEANVAREQLLAQNQHLSMKAKLINLLQEALFARRLVKAVRREILPEAKSILATYSKGYTAGRYTLLELTQAQDALLQARLRVLDAAVEYQVKRNEIDRLTGGVMGSLSDREAG